MKSYVVPDMPKRSPDALETLASSLGLKNSAALRAVVEQLATAQLLLFAEILQPLVARQVGRPSVPSSAKKTETGPLLVSISETMRLLSMSRTSVYFLMSSGRLTWVKPGAHRRIRMDSIHRMLMEGDARAG